MIREAQKEDCINLAVLSSQVWLETYAIEGVQTKYSKYVTSTFTEAHFLALLENPIYHLLISETENTLQGFILVNLESQYQNESNGFEIEKLYLHKKFRGQGFAQDLLFEVEQKLGSKFWLYTWVENESNEFYKHLGFKHAGQLTFEFLNTIIVNNVYTFNRT